MGYNLVVTEKADELIDSVIFYIMNKLKNPQAAGHLLDNIFEIYGRLEDNPFQFGDCKDYYLKCKGYKEALIPGMQYILVFRIAEQTVYIVGLFHTLEDYSSKVSE